MKKPLFTLNIIQEEIDFLESLLDDFDIKGINKRIEFLEKWKKLFIEKTKVFELMDRYMWNDVYKPARELIKDEIRKYDYSESEIIN